MCTRLTALCVVIVCMLRISKPSTHKLKHILCEWIWILWKLKIENSRIRWRARHAFGRRRAEWPSKFWRAAAFDVNDCACAQFVWDAIVPRDVPNITFIAFAHKNPPIQMRMEHFRLFPCYFIQQVRTMESRVMCVCGTECSSLDQFWLDTLFVVIIIHNRQTQRIDSKKGTSEKPKGRQKTQSKKMRSMQCC